MTINISTVKLLKIVQFSLLVSIFGLLLWSAPWSESTSTLNRTITVTGESTVTAAPDEFTFYPYFQESGTDKEALKKNLTTKANDAVEKLKELGVSEDKITLDASSYDYWYYNEGQKGNLNIRLEIVVADKEVAQKVQDYLLTIDVKGQLSPQATFSKTLQKKLDAQAIEEASNDARSKAETQANLFNAKLGKVITINQGSDSIFYSYGQSGGLELAAVTDGDDTANSSLPVLPGENEYTQTISVVYELR